jgi:phosphatidylglycerol---prolipoprotein diacylglyceryl transferase
MIEIPFDPEIHFGPLSLAWHGIFTAVGIFFGVWLAVRLLRGRVSEEAAYSVATWGVVGGIVGARLLHVIDCWLPSATCGAGYAADPLRIVMIWTGGIAVWGAAIGGVLGGFIAAVRRGDVAIGASADAAAPSIGLGFAIGRIGDIINGEHHASLCGDGPGVCVTYTDPNTLGQGPSFAPGDPRFAEGPVHLVVLYDMVWNLVGVGLALLVRRRLAGRVPEGRVFWLWIVWYGIGRLLLGFLRVADPHPVSALRQDQLVSLIAILVAIPVLALIQIGLLPRVLGAVRARISPAT